MFSCSALRRAHREALIGDCDDVLLVNLAGDYDTIHARVAARPGHWFAAGLVRSQFETLEPPADALTLDVREPIDVLVERVVAALA